MAKFTTRTKLLALLGGLGIIAAGAATAQGWGSGHGPGEGMGRGMGMHHGYDKDRGKTMGGEGQARRGPGRGSAGGEGRRGEGSRFMQRFGAIDINGDGVVSDDEAAGAVEGVFLAMDADDDGMLTVEEYMAIRMGAGDGNNAARQAERQQDKRDRFAPMDVDGDGKVSKAEFLSGGRTRFAKADTDSDGKVTPWEFRAQHWR